MQTTNEKTDNISRKLTVDDLRQAKIVCLAATGKKITHIAQDEGMSRQWISEVVNRPEAQPIFQEILATTLQEAAERLPSLIDAAITYTESQLRSEWKADDRPAKLATAIRLLELILKYQPGCNGCSLNQSQGGNYK